MSFVWAVVGGSAFVLFVLWNRDRIHPSRWFRPSDYERDGFNYMFGNEANRDLSYTLRSRKALVTAVVICGWLPALYGVVRLVRWF